jgi:hypothetical protein
MSDHDAEHDDRRGADADADADADGRGKLRLRWPTFRGAPFLWGVLAFPLFLHLVTTAVSIGQGAPLTPGLVVFAVVVAVAFVVCVVGVVQTLRHPRPSPPSWLDEGDPRA